MTSKRSSFSAELQVALSAAAEAADLLAARAGAESVREKARADLVTAVDEASERAIQARVLASFPDDAFVAEEFSYATVDAGRCWIVDPLDGTINYVHGHPFACVSIALVDEQGPAVGVIHAPFLGEVYHATRGGGAFLDGRAIHVSSVADLRGALLATGFPFKPGKGRPGPYMEMVTEFVLGSHGVRRAGAAAIDLAYVASGRVDAFFEIGLAPWDIAAGLLLVTEAGGIVSGWPDDDDPPLATGRVLASNGALHGSLMEIAGRYVDRL